MKEENKKIYLLLLRFSPRNLMPELIITYQTNIYLHFFDFILKLVVDCIAIYIYIIIFRNNFHNCTDIRLPEKNPLHFRYQDHFQHLMNLYKEAHSLSRPLVDVIIFFFGFGIFRHAIYDIIRYIYYNKKIFHQILKY